MSDAHTRPADLNKISKFVPYEGHRVIVEGSDDNAANAPRLCRRAIFVENFHQHGFRADVILTARRTLTRQMSYLLRAIAIEDTRPESLLRLGACIGRQRFTGCNDLVEPQPNSAGFENEFGENVQ